MAGRSGPRASGANPRARRTNPRALAPGATLKALTIVGGDVVADGRVVGRVRSLEIELDEAWLGGHLPKGEGGENHHSDGVGSKDGESEGKPSRGEPLAPKVRDLHAHFVAVTGPPNAELTPSRDRMYRKGLAEHTVETCKQAIDGLVAYAARRGGNLNLSRVFQTRPGGSPLGEQIEWWAKQAPDAPVTSAFIPSDVAAVIQDAKRDVQMAASFAGNEQLKAKGQEAIATLRQHGIEVEWFSTERGGVTVHVPEFVQGSPS